MVPGIDPKVDYAFKRLFGTERNLGLLAHFVNAVLQPPPQASVAELELLNPFNPKDSLDDKLSVVDVKARDQLGRLFNVEMQMIPNPRDFPKRLLYYWARLYGQQLQEGNKYALLRPTITSCMVNGVLFPGVTAHHLAFRLWDVERSVGFLDDLAMHVFELPKCDRAIEQLTGPLDVWLYFLRHGATLDTEALAHPLDIVPIRQAMEELRMLSQDDLERERYEARLKLQRDAISLIDAYETELVEKTAQARAEGALIGRILLSQRLLGQTPTPESALLAVSQEDLTRLAERLEQELLNRPR